MNVESVYDDSFKSYGHVIEGYDTGDLLNALENETPLPLGVEYVASCPALEALPVKAFISSNEYGGMPVQLGYCNGHNTKLNCLEYHRGSEINLGTKDFILLLARLDDIEGGKLDTGKVRAFKCPAGVMIEVFGTTLHYAPCDAKSGEGFKVLVALPEGTNGEKPEISPLNDEDRLLWARNKWLLAHPESDEAKQGAVCALFGDNIDIKNILEVTNND